MASRIWRPWYHSTGAWHLHQRALRDGAFFRPAPLTIPRKIQLLQLVPHYLQASWQHYVPTAFPHYRHGEHLLTRVDDQYFLYGHLCDDELFIHDFLLEEVAERWYQR